MRSLYNPGLDLHLQPGNRLYHRCWPVASISHEPLSLCPQLTQIRNTNGQQQRRLVRKIYVRHLTDSDQVMRGCPSLQGRQNGGDRPVQWGEADQEDQEARRLCPPGTLSVCPFYFSPPLHEP